VIQVLSNLLGNALKFVPEHDLIQIRARAQGGDVCFTVSDDGPGIAAHQQEHLFERYWKGKTEDRRGVGLGLHIAKGIVEAHRGRIWVESRLGAGSTFCFTIPVA
jgi:signal transduction histidine kinase